MTHLDDKIALTGGGRGIGLTKPVKSVRERETVEQVLCRIAEAGCVRPGR